MPTVNIICTERRGGIVVAWHDSHRENPHLVSPVELRCSDEDVQVAVEEVLGRILIPPPPTAEEEYIAELEVENKDLREQLVVRRDI